MSFVTLPAELRALIYDFCFPPAHTRVQLIPYHASAPACHLNLPLSLYLVCKLVYTELPQLSSKLRTLDLLYIIKGPAIERCWSPEDKSREDDDPDLRHFQTLMQFAERIRLVGAIQPSGRSIQCASSRRTLGRAIELARGGPIHGVSRRLKAGSDCALKVLEIQPLLWPKRSVTRTVLSCLGPLATHVDVAQRLEVRLIADREGAEPCFDVDEEYNEYFDEEVNEELDAIKDWLRRYQGLRDGDVSRRFSQDGSSDF